MATSQVDNLNVAKISEHNHANFVSVYKSLHETGRVDPDMCIKKYISPFRKPKIARNAYEVRSIMKLRKKWNEISVKNTFKSEDLHSSYGVGKSEDKHSDVDNIFDPTGSVRGSGKGLDKNEDISRNSKAGNLEVDKCSNKINFDPDGKVRGTGKALVNSLVTGDSSFSKHDLSRPEIEQNSTAVNVKYSRQEKEKIIGLSNLPDIQCQTYSKKDTNDVLTVLGNNFYRLCKYGSRQQKVRNKHVQTYKVMSDKMSCKNYVKHETLTKLAEPFEEHIITGIRSSEDSKQTVNKVTEGLKQNLNMKSSSKFKSTFSKCVMIDKKPYVSIMKATNPIIPKNSTEKLVYSDLGNSGTVLSNVVSESYTGKIGSSRLANIAIERTEIFNSGARVNNSESCTDSTTKRNSESATAHNMCSTNDTSLNCSGKSPNQCNVTSGHEDCKTAGSLSFETNAAEVNSGVNNLCESVSCVPCDFKTTTIQVPSVSYKINDNEVTLHQNSTNEISAADLINPSVVSNGNFKMSINTTDESSVMMKNSKTTCLSLPSNIVLKILKPHRSIKGRRCSASYSEEIQLIPVNNVKLIFKPNNLNCSGNRKTSNSSVGRACTSEFIKVCKSDVPIKQSNSTVLQEEGSQAVGGTSEKLLLDSRRVYLLPVVNSSKETIRHGSDKRISTEEEAKAQKPSKERILCCREEKVKGRKIFQKKASKSDYSGQNKQQETFACNVRTEEHTTMDSDKNKTQSLRVANIGAPTCNCHIKPVPDSGTNCEQCRFENTNIDSADFVTSIRRKYSKLVKNYARFGQIDECVKLTRPFSEKLQLKCKSAFNEELTDNSVIGLGHNTGSENCTKYIKKRVNQQKIDKSKKVLASKGKSRELVFRKRDGMKHKFTVHKELADGSLMDSVHHAHTENHEKSSLIQGGLHKVRKASTNREKNLGFTGELQVEGKYAFCERLINNSSVDSFHHANTETSEELSQHHLQLKCSKRKRDYCSMEEDIKKYKKYKHRCENRKHKCQSKHKHKNFNKRVSCDQVTNKVLMKNENNSANYTLHGERSESSIQNGLDKNTKMGINKRKKVELDFKETSQIEQKFPGTDEMTNNSVDSVDHTDIEKFIKVDEESPVHSRSKCSKKKKKQCSAEEDVKKYKRHKAFSKDKVPVQTRSNRVKRTLAVDCLEKTCAENSEFANGKHLHSVYKPVKLYITPGGIPKIKKPRIAKNIFEVKKIIKMEKKLKRKMHKILEDQQRVNINIKHNETSDKCFKKCVTLCDLLTSSFDVSKMVVPEFLLPKVYVHRLNFNDMYEKAVSDYCDVANISHITNRKNNNNNNSVLEYCSYNSDKDMAVIVEEIPQVDNALPYSLVVDQWVL